MQPPHSTSESSNSGVSHIEQFYIANAQTQKPRPERQRDVLFGAGCGLLCFGLFPFSALAAVAGDGASLADEFDATTRTLSLAFSLMGLSCVTLSCVVMTRAKLRVVLLALMAPLLACILVSCSTILEFSTVDDVVNVLRNTRVVSMEQESSLEHSVNSLFCDAHARTLCETRDLTRAEDVFDISALEDIETTCTRLDHQQIQKAYIDPLVLIAAPSSTAMQWCGIYMTAPEDVVLVEKERSPYHQHRLEVLDHLMRALGSRQARTKLLMVLEWFALPAFFAVVWWWRSPSSKVQAAARHVHVVV